ncbi:hypothetical protein, partial [uncultured Treponema sp.]|uniref:hypothetical protein n=1 Tax=uncultured Treponema sp. TaxID=162155 RepID=UPI00280AA0E5
LLQFLGSIPFVFMTESKTIFFVILGIDPMSYSGLNLCHYPARSDNLFQIPASSAGMTFRTY